MECPRISLKNTVIDVTKKTSVRHSSTHQIEEVYLGTSILAGLITDGPRPPWPTQPIRTLHAASRVHEEYGILPTHVGRLCRRTMQTAEPGIMQSPDFR